jgi:F0F1-type ATP synthase assembly protein I
LSQRDPNHRDAGEGTGLSSREGAKAYQFAMEAVFSIPVAIGMGWWADSYFETSPIGLLAGVAVGFGAFVYRLVRMRRLVEKAAADAEANDVPRLAFDDESETDDR